MKLLLTSGGITNKSIAKALFELVGKKPEETSLVFIPTAANVEMGDKSWFIDDLMNLKKQNFKSIDIADISAVDKKIWLPKFEAADVLFFEGGDSAHLMKWMNQSGLVSILPDLLKTKLYVGLSAGSMVTCKSLLMRTLKTIYGEDTLNKFENPQALGFVDFYFFPHLNSPHFTKRLEPIIREATKGMSEKIYVLDDQSALKVVDGKVEAISEGKWFVING